MQNAPAFRLQSTKTERQVRVCEFQNRTVSCLYLENKVFTLKCKNF